jgi:hypothetical protein
LKIHDQRVLDLLEIHDQRERDLLEIHDQRVLDLFWEIHDQRVLDLLEIHQIFGMFKLGLEFLEGKTLIRRLNLASYRCEDRIFQMSSIYD